MLAFFKKHSLIVVSIAFSIISIQIAFSNVRGIGGHVIAGRVISFVTAPVMSTVNSTVDGIRDVWGHYIYLINLEKENDDLKMVITKLNEENNAIKEGLLENARLKKLLLLAEGVPFSFTGSNIIGVNNSGWFRTVTIDRGAEHGIKKDMPVFSSNGIIGRVTEAYPKTSNVLLVIDPRSNIDVTIQRSRAKGIAEGRGDNRLALKYVQQFEDVQIGDAVVSAGIGGVFPKGVMVGEVVKIEKDDNSFFKSIEIKTSVDFRKLEEVLVAIEPKK